MDGDTMQAKNRHISLASEKKLARHPKPGYEGAMHIPTPDEIEAAANAKGLSIAALCRRADVDASAFHRWRAGKNVPNLATVKSMLDAIAAAPEPVPEA